MEKSLDKKIARILADPRGGEFILADAKDADMAGGLSAPGKSPEHHAHEGRFRSLAQYRQLIVENVQQGLIDVMLMSVSTSELLTIEQRLFDASHVTPAIRANDTSDIWLAGGGRYPQQPARPFRTATIDHAMCGKIACSPAERKLGADLGLFSLTFNNDAELDRAMLEAYKGFREEAEPRGFRHFLEIFDPNACGDHCPPDFGRFIADQVARTLAGVPQRGRPIFLMIPYHGPAALEPLVRYDRSLIVGILGGAAGTTLDAFKQLVEARKYGAKAALYGRIINAAEHQPTFIQHLRWVADGQLTDPAEAVRSYHAALQKLGIQPYRPLTSDLLATLRDSSYGATGGKTAAVVNGLKEAAGPAKADDHECHCGGACCTEKAAAKPAPKNTAPDFASMTSAQRAEYHRQRLSRMFR